MTDPEPTTAADFPRLYVPPDDATDLAELSQPVTLPFEFHGEPPAVGKVATADAPPPRYLVLLQGAGEDIPLGLFDSYAEAVAYAEEVRANPTAHAERYFAVVRPDLTLFTPNWLAITLVEFDGPTPAKSLVLFDLD